MADAFVSSAAAAPSARPRMNAWQQAALSLYWFATNAHWTAILTMFERITASPWLASDRGASNYAIRKVHYIDYG